MHTWAVAQGELIDVGVSEMMQDCDVGHFITSSLAFRLIIICNGCDLFYLKKRIQLFEHLFMNSRPFSEGTKAGISYCIIKCWKKIDATCRMQNSGFRRRDSPGWHRIASCNNNDALILGGRFRQRVQYMHWNEFQGPAGGERFHKAFSPDTVLDPGAVSTGVRHFLSAAAHVRPVDLAFHGVVHATSAEVSRQSGISDSSRGGVDEGRWAPPSLLHHREVCSEVVVSRGDQPTNMSWTPHRGCNFPVNLVFGLFG